MFVKFKAGFVHEIGEPLNVHEKLSGKSPVALTESVTFCPAFTIWFDNPRVICGGTSTVICAPVLVALP
jgi:hypothetical protein